MQRGHRNISQHSEPSMLYPYIFSMCFQWIPHISIVVFVVRSKCDLHFTYLWYVLKLQENLVSTWFKFWMQNHQWKMIPCTAALVKGIITPTVLLQAHWKIKCNIINVWLGEWKHSCNLEIALLIYIYINGLVQKRRNSSVLAMKLHLSCINPSTCLSHKIHTILFCSKTSYFAVFKFGLEPVNFPVHCIFINFGISEIKNKTKILSNIQINHDRNYSSILQKSSFNTFFHNSLLYQLDNWFEVWLKCNAAHWQIIWKLYLHLKGWK